MSEGGEWCLIESDPGVFTELIRGFGATGLECEEVYDLKELENITDALGLIFLFKWESANTESGDVVLDANGRGLFFAKQVISNACATQAIINILLNFDEHKVDLGDTLKQFKSFVSDFDSAMKGIALSNCDQIREVHNSFTNHHVFEFDEKLSKKSQDSYHFVGYLPVNNVLYELDGLKEGPIDHGVISESSSWLDTARPILENRMKKCVDGKFSLMAVVPHRLTLYEQQLANLHNSNETKSPDLIQELEKNIAIEKQKANIYRQENIRRRHNYLPCIVEILKILAENASLIDSLNKAKVMATERISAKNNHKK